MAIIAYVGLPGHGKSYGVVENVIVPALKASRTVFTNIPMHDDVCLELLGSTVVPFTTDDILKNPNWFRDIFISGSIMVWDELWRALPSGMRANQIGDQYKTFFAEHRHLVGENGFSTEIYLVTQDLSQIATFVRELVETTVRMVKRVNLGLDKRFRVDIYSGAVTGSKPPVSKREREIHGGKFKQDIYKFYKSHTKSQTGLAGDESKTDKRGNVLKGLGLKVGLIFIVAMSVYIIWGAQRVKKAYSAPEPQAVPQSPSSPQTQPNGAQQPHTQPVKPSNPQFLADAKKLYISHTIGTKSGLTTYYKITFSDYEVEVTRDDLLFLGYKLTPITSCIVKVVGDDFNGFFMCPKHDPDKGLMASIGADIVGASNDSHQ
jgi:zona occludens toxin